MISRFYKGALRKELVCTKAPAGCYRNQKYLVSIYPSDNKGHILITRERHEEVPNRESAKALFLEWAKELLKKGWVIEDKTPNEKQAVAKQEEQMKSNNVMSWYESTSYVVSEFMKKAETEEEVKFIADCISGVLDNALKDATVRMTIQKKFPAIGEADVPTAVKGNMQKQK